MFGTATTTATERLRRGDRQSDWMPDTNVPRAVVRGAALAVWSWIGLAAMLSAFSGHRAARAVLGPGDTPEQFRAALDASSGAPDVFVSVVTLQFGQSRVVSPGTGVWTLLGARGEKTALLGATTLLLAGLLAVAGVVLARSAPPAGEALGYLGAVPGVGWLYLLLLAGLNGVVPLMLPAQGLGLVGPAVALAIPVGVAAARVAAGAADVRDWALDGWLYLAWLPLGLVVAEMVFAVNGIGRLWFTALVHGDYTVFVGTSVVFSTPLVLASVAREGVLARGDAGGRRTHRRSGTTDGGVSTSPPVVRSDPRVLVGLGVLATVAVVGLVGSLVTTVPDRPADRVLVLARVLDGLGVLVVFVLAAGAVAAVPGVLLGRLAGRGFVAGTLVRALLDPFANVPVAVVVVSVLFATGNLLAVDGSAVTYGAVAGATIAPLVVRRVERERRERPHARPLSAVLPGVGVLATGIGVLAFVVADLALLGIAPTPLTAVLANTTYPETGAVETLLVVVPVTLPLFVLGEGLRRAGDRA